LFLDEVNYDPSACFSSLDCGVHHVCKNLRVIGLVCPDVQERKSGPGKDVIDKSITPKWTFALTRGIVKLNCERWCQGIFRIRDGFLTLFRHPSTPHRFVRCNSPVDPEFDLRHSHWFLSQRLAASPMEMREGDTLGLALGVDESG
jgi:hypothetical protein